MSAPTGFLLVSAATAQTIWIGSLVIFVVVLVVVAILLESIRRPAGDILAGVDAIWTAGKKIAGNTVQIVTLGAINRTAGEIVATAGAIHEQLGRIENHAAGCPGCPQCAMGPPAGGIG